MSFPPPQFPQFLGFPQILTPTTLTGHFMYNFRSPAFVRALVGPPPPPPFCHFHNPILSEMVSRATIGRTLCHGRHLTTTTISLATSRTAVLLSVARPILGTLPRFANIVAFAVLCLHEELIRTVHVYWFVINSHFLLHVLSTLSLSRNRSLDAILTLATELEKVFQLMSISNKEEAMFPASEDTCSENDFESSIQSRNEIISSGNEVSPEVEVSLKKRRAATEHIASITLTDLSNYFHLPITEASKNLKVGLTVLKRKCREFGIPRWPHRKIKSLDTLINDLQEEVKRQQRENREDAVKAVTRRQRKIQSEKEYIERRPSTDLKMETKRFRQDVFKRKHKAKVLDMKC